MDLDDLQAFLAVVDTGSVARAAAVLGLPRSTLRRRLAELTARASVLLIATSPTGISLTEPGAVLARTGRVVLARHTALMAAVRAAGATSPETASNATPAPGAPGHLP